MRLESLPTPGAFKGARKLLIEIVQAISFAEVAAAHTNGRSEQAERLREFFQAAADHCASLKVPVKLTKKKE